MARTLKSDAVLFGTTLLLLVIGMAWVYSASVVEDRTRASWSSRASSWCSDWPGCSSR